MAFKIPRNDSFNYFFAGISEAITFVSNIDLLTSEKAPITLSDKTQASFNTSAQCPIQTRSPMSKSPARFNKTLLD